MSFKLFVCFFSAVTILGGASGLKCHICDYVYGLTNDDDCGNSPNNGSLYEITDDLVSPLGAGILTHSLPSMPLLPHRGNNSESVNENDEAWPHKFCVKLTGRLGDKRVKYISRRAVGGEYPDSYTNGCVDLGEISDIQEFKACFCDTDGCNRSSLNSVTIPTLLFVMSTILYSFSI